MSARGSHRDGGFALIVLLGVTGAASIGILLAVQALVPATRDRQRVAEHNLAQAVTGARIAFRRTGAFPGDLSSVAAAAGMDPDGAWRRDPFGRGEELDYRVTATGVRLRSRGADGVLGNSDDEVYDLPTETRLRCRQRPRLRLLRAVLSRSVFRSGGAMAPGDEQAMVAAMRSYADARRRWLTADTTTRDSLTSTMATAAATVNTLVTNYSLPPLPGSLTGAGGLMSRLGMQDWRARDGAGQDLLADPVLGWVAAGSDGVGGTDDDM